MSNSKQRRENKASSPEEDAIREERNQSRVNRSHGGNLLEAVAPEELEPMNDTECVHETAIRDFTEKDFIAFKCANPRCGLVRLFEKPKI